MRPLSRQRLRLNKHAGDARKSNNGRKEASDIGTTITKGGMTYGSFTAGCKEGSKKTKEQEEIISLKRWTHLVSGLRDSDGKRRATGAATSPGMFIVPQWPIGIRTTIAKASLFIGRGH